MAIQRSVGVTVQNNASHRSTNGSQTPVKHKGNQSKLPQIPNQRLLVSGSVLPQRPAFNSVSTGSAASNHQATLVKTVPAQKARPVKTVAVLAPGSLPQTGEVVMGGAVLLGLILLAILGLRLVRPRHE